EGAPQSGVVEVAIAAPARAAWASAFPATTFVKASESPSRPLVYAPVAAKGPSSLPNLVFIPGQGTSFKGNAARLARLQALLGPQAKPLLLNWSNPGSSDGFRTNASDSFANRTLASLLKSLGTDGATPLSLVAEGRGAELLRRSLDRTSTEARSH